MMTKLVAMNEWWMVQSNSTYTHKAIVNVLVFVFSLMVIFSCQFYDEQVKYNHIIWSKYTLQIRHVLLSDMCRIRHRYDADTYNYIKLCHFFKLLVVSVSMSCPNPCSWVISHISCSSSNKSYRISFDLIIKFIDSTMEANLWIT